MEHTDTSDAMALAHLQRWQELIDEYGVTGLQKYCPGISTARVQVIGQLLFRPGHDLHGYLHRDQIRYATLGLSLKTVDRGIRDAIQLGLFAHYKQKKPSSPIKYRLSLNGLESLEVKLRQDAYERNGLSLLRTSGRNRGP